MSIIYEDVHHYYRNKTKKRKPPKWPSHPKLKVKMAGSVYLVKNKRTLTCWSFWWCFWARGSLVGPRGPQTSISWPCWPVPHCSSPPHLGGPVWAGSRVSHRPSPCGRSLQRTNTVCVQSTWWSSTTWLRVKMFKSICLEEISNNQGIIIRVFPDTRSRTFGRRRWSTSSRPMISLPFPVPSSGSTYLSDKRFVRDITLRCTSTSSRLYASNCRNHVIRIDVSDAGNRWAVELL